MLPKKKHDRQKNLNIDQTIKQRTRLGAFAEQFQLNYRAYNMLASFLVARRQAACQQEQEEERLQARVEPLPFCLSLAKSARAIRRVAGTKHGSIQKRQFIRINFRWVNYACAKRDDAPSISFFIRELLPYHPCAHQRVKQGAPALS